MRGIEASSKKKREPAPQRGPRSAASIARSSSTSRSTLSSQPPVMRCDCAARAALIASFAERAKLSFLMLAGVERGLFDAKSLRP